MSDQVRCTVTGVVGDMHQVYVAGPEPVEVHREVWVAEGVRYDADDPFVVRHPDIFTPVDDEPTPVQDRRPASRRKGGVR